VANPKPDATRARLGKRATRRPKPGTVKQLTAVVWSAIRELEAAIEPAVIDGSLEPDEQQKDFAVQVGELTRLTHALSQAASVYLKAIEVGEIEARIAEIEQQMKMRR